jgi:PHD/YefM family antitoxin component YafN of YafNO toxin-antitoxin module
VKKDKEKNEGAEKEEPIAILRNNKGEFVAYIYEEDQEVFDVDIEMSDYYIERLN